MLLRFTRTEAPRSGARWIDTMGIAAMTSMVFVDGDNGPSHEEVVRRGTRSVRATGPLPRAPARDARQRTRGPYRSGARILARVCLRAAGARTCVTRRRPSVARRTVSRRQARRARQTRVGGPSAGTCVARARGPRRDGACRGLRRANGLDRARSWPQQLGHWNSSSVHGRSPSATRRRPGAVILPPAPLVRCRTLLRAATPLFRSASPLFKSAIPLFKIAITMRAALARSSASGSSGPMSGASSKPKRLSAAPVRQQICWATCASGTAPGGRWPAASIGNRATTRRR